MRQPLVCQLTACALALAVAACGDPITPIIDAAISDGPTTDGQSGGPVNLPRSVDLGPVDCGGSTTGMFTVMNSSATDVSVALASADPAFTVVPADVTIMAGTSTTFTVTATAPASAIAGAPLTTTFTATTNIPGRETVMIPVAATTRGARLVVSPPTLNFGDVGVGTGASLSFVVSNTGNGPADVAIDGAAGPAAEVTFGSKGAASVGPGAMVAGSVRFTPSELAAYTGTAAMLVRGAICGSAPSELRVTGTGVADGGVLIVGGPVAFPEVGCEAAATTATVTIDNQSTAPASFTAALPVDPQGDELRYTVTPASGTVAPGASQQLTITRLPVARPFVPRAIDATLRLTVNGTSTDVAITQTIRAPFLTADRSSQDFGYQPAESSTPAPIRLTNTGNALAMLDGTATGSFVVSLAATLAAGASDDGELRFEPTSSGIRTGTATIDAVEACSAPIDIAVTGGDGPYAELAIGDSTTSCPNPTGGTTTMTVQNPGTQPLTLDCVEDGASGLDPVFTGLPVTVPAGGSATIDLAHSAGPTVAGDLVATFACTTNEPLTSTRRPTLTRTMLGAQIELAAADPLDFTCFDGTFATFTTRNAGNQSVFLSPDAVLAFPLFLNFDFSTLAPGDTTSHTIQNSIPSFALFGGGPDVCAGAVGSGGLMWEGTVGVGAGSGDNVCGVVPATLPVRMFDYTIIAE